MGAATAGLLQQASAPLSGTFIVGHTGTWSAPIEARQSTTSWTYLTEQISSLRLAATDASPSFASRRTVDADGQLELECWRHPDGWANGGTLAMQPLSTDVGLWVLEGSIDYRGCRGGRSHSRHGLFSWWQRPELTGTEAPFRATGRGSAEVLALFGVGLRGLNCSNVLVAGVACTEPAASRIEVMSSGSLVCLTPPMDGFNPDDQNNWPSTTPAEITLTKPADRGLASASGETALPIVQFGERMGSVTSQDGPLVAEVRYPTRWAPSEAAPTPPLEAVTVPLAWIPGKGFAAVLQSVTFESRFEVTEVLPAIASKAGGVVVFLTGAGFHPWSAAKHLINFELEDGTSRPCEAPHGRSHLRCPWERAPVPTPSHGAEENRLLSLPEIRPLVPADSDRALRRHVFSASIAGKGPQMQPLQGPPVHFYSKHIDTLGISGLGNVLQKPGCKRGPCASMGSASTGRGEYPLPVAGYHPKRGHSMANLKATAIDQMLSRSPAQRSVPKMSEGVKLPAIRAKQRSRRPERFVLVRLPHWPEGVAKRVRSPRSCPRPSMATTPSCVVCPATLPARPRRPRRRSLSFAAMLERMTIRRCAASPKRWPAPAASGRCPRTPPEGGRARCWSGFDAPNWKEEDVTDAETGLAGLPRWGVASDEEWSISFLYSVVKGEAIGDDADYYSDGAWCDKCGDNAGLEADLYCVDCEAYFCWSCSGRWHHPGGCNELHSLEHIVKDESKGLRILTPLLDELLVGLAAYLLISGLREYVDKDYLRRSDICPGIRTLQDGLAWVDTLLFYHFKDTLMTSCSTEDNFWKLLLDSWVRTVLTDSDSLLLLLRTLPNALLIHYMARTFIVPPFAVAYAVLLVVVRSLEARLPRTRLLRFLASLAQRVSALSARFVSYNLQAPAKTLPRVRPSQDLGEWWVYWSGRQVRWFHFYYSAAKECTTLLLANVMRLTVLFRCLGLLLGVGKLVRWLLDMAGLQEEIRMQQSWFQSVHHMWDTDQLLWQGLASSVMMTTELVKRADARGIAVVLLGAAFLIAFDVLLRFGIVRKRWFYQRGVQRSVLLPLLVVLVVVPTARFGFFLEFERSSEPSSVLLQEPGWTEVEDFGAEDDSDGHSLGRSLAYDNSSDSSEIGPPEILTLALSLNGVVPTCRALEGCGLNLTDAATPVVKRVTPRNGSYADGINVVITLSMMDKPEQVQIFFGPFECPNPVVSQSGGDWTITVPLCSFEASKTPVYVLTSSGYAVGASPITGAGFYFEQLLRLSSIVASSGSFYGGTLVAIRGAGLGPSLGMNYATVGGTPCEVASASNDEVQCYTPAAPSELANANESTRTLEVKVHVMSAEASQTRVTVCGEPCEVSTSDGSSVAETVFEVRSFSGNLTWTEVASVRDTTITGSTIAQGWTSFPIVGAGPNGSAVAQAFRVRILPDACRSSGEIMRGVRFRGILLNKGNTNACPIEVDSVSHPLASAIGGSALLPVVLSYSVERTPVVAYLTPNRGTARGDTLVTLLGQGLEPLDSQGSATSVSSDNAQITFNQYPCRPDSANSTALSCYTTERNAGIFAPFTQVFLGGRGYAIISLAAEDTVFRYVDKWSNIYSWQDSEPPVDGDSVVVPEGQAIMLDVDSPKLFLLLISGYFEFDRKDDWIRVMVLHGLARFSFGGVNGGMYINRRIHHSGRIHRSPFSVVFDPEDLQLDSTYIWIAGGNFYVGSEAAPFLHQATITLHGDRWHTIELPVIGSKMLAVTDLGGLGTCAHLYDRNVRLSQTGKHYVDPCPVKLVGRLELHGRPGISWTRLVETAPAGADLLKLEEAVDWEIGTEVVITPSERHAEEVRKVLSLEDNGFTLRLDEPLRHEHLGTWYYNDEIPTPTDLRAAVGRLNRNVKVQGDEKSLSAGNSFMFGVHIGAFHGGIMRIENTEITRSGQAANFGRYSSHWHVLSPHRTVDVADVAFLRNNSYHDTFQRAVVHSTDFAVVRDNVALKTKGHSFFTEAGDEVFTLYEHNLAVHPLQHPLLLDDDMDPAGSWRQVFALIVMRGSSTSVPSLPLLGGGQMPMAGVGMCCRDSARGDAARQGVLDFLLQGGRHVDTAQLYGNHREVGEGVRLAIEQGVPREEIFLTTKIWPDEFGFEKAMAWAPQMLDELGLEYVDLVLLHMASADDKESLLVLLPKHV
eukprot:g27030.t2